MLRTSSVAIAAVLLTACSSPTDLVPCGTRWAEVRWTPLGLDGAVVTAITDTEWGLFAGTRTRGVFRLSADTEEWVTHGLEEVEIRSLRFVGPPDRLLAGVSWRSLEQPTEAALFASDDAGQSWRASDSGLAAEHEGRYSVYDIAVDPRDRRHVFAGAAGGVLRSRDAGVSWRVVRPAPSVTAIGFAPVETGIVLAGYGDAFGFARLLRSTDGGESWHAIDVPSGSIAVSSAFAVDPGNSDRIWMAAGSSVLRSENRGFSWNWDSDRLTAAEGPIRGLLAVDDALIAAASLNLGEDLGITVSCDLGESWETVLAPEGAAGAVVLAPALNGSVLVGTEGTGVWRLEPAGRD